MYAKIEADLDARDQRRREVTAARQRRHVARLKGNDPDRKLITISSTRGELEDLEAIAREIYSELENRPDREPVPALRSAAVSLLLRAYKDE